MAKRRLPPKGELVKRVLSRSTKLLKSFTNTFCTYDKAGLIVCLLLFVANLEAIELLLFWRTHA